MIRPLWSFLEQDLPGRTGCKVVDAKGHLTAELIPASRDDLALVGQFHASNPMTNRPQLL